MPIRDIQKDIINSTEFSTKLIIMDEGKTNV